MPTYGYQCKSCSYEFEEFQKISEEPLVECPSCKKKTLIRIIGGGAGLHFKGSGFYLTDYKKTSTSASSSKEETKSSTPKSDGKSADSSPSAPALKGESSGSKGKSDSSGGKE